MRIVRKMVIWLMVLLLVATPVSNVGAASAASSQPQGWNEALLQFLTDEYGSEWGPELYQWLRDVRLIDDNGQLVRHPILLDGQAYTLEEFKALLESGEPDLTKTAYVDGQPIPVEALKTIIELEDRLSMLAGDSRLRASTAGHSVLSAGGGATDNHDDYDDEVYVMLTEYKHNLINRTTYYDPYTFVPYTHQDYYVTLKFELNQPQTHPVSFAYEVIQGTLQSGYQHGTVVFQPGETEVEIDIVPAEPFPDKSSNQQNWIINGLDLNYYEDWVWIEFARADYIHFFDFKNFDRMEIQVKDITFVDERRILNPVRRVHLFSHEYEGGAYIAFAPKRGLGDDSITTIIHLLSDWPELLESYALNHYLDDKFTDMEEVHAQSGIYRTGQIFPYRVKFQIPVTHLGPVPTEENDPRLILRNGRTAVPDVMMEPIYRSHGFFVENLRDYYFNYGGLAYGGVSHWLGYQTVIEKNTELNDLIVERNEGEAHHDFFEATSQLLRQNSGLMVDEPFPEYVYKVFPGDTWDQAFTNHADLNIVFANHRADAFKSLRLEVDGEERTGFRIGETVTVTLELDDDNDRADWIIDGGTNPEELSRKLIVSIGDKETGVIEMDWVREENGDPAQPLRLQGSFVVTQELFDLMTEANKKEGEEGKLRAKIYYEREPYSHRSDYVPDDSGDDGERVRFGMLHHPDFIKAFTIGQPKYIEDNELEIVYPSDWPSGEPYVVYLTSNISTRLGYSFPPGKTYSAPDQFVWSSDDPDSAEIRDDGTIVPLKAGTVTFTLTALNGGYQPVQVTSHQIEIRSGGDPAVVVPDFANRVYAPVGRPATVVWTTNVMQKYKELAGGGTPKDAHFTVELFEGYLQSESDLAGKTSVASWSAPTESRLVNATSFTISGEYLGTISTGNQPSYTVRISTEHPAQPGVTLSALAYIVVNSPPVVVTLDKSALDSYVTDDIGSIDLKWTLQNFDKQNGGDFEFRITKNGAEIARIADSGTGVQETGFYPLDIDAVADGRLKDTYAITLTAKNNLDEAWSYDSFYLQVYRKDAFRILVDGDPAASVKMSNVDRIAAMDNDQRLALKRQIYLQNEVGINYGDYADWSQLTDQFAWEYDKNPDGSASAVLYFTSGGRTAAIDGLGYSSYQPKHRFQLAGIGDGQTMITATHVNTGVQVELDVTVETLRDKLYLFQFYPKAKTTVTYTDKNGVKKTAESNGSGELALFDPDGIGSDVYATSRLADPNDASKTVTYTGIISRETILSKERDPATLELYPVNILQLRKLSEVEVYFKKPDGTPYTGKVTYRAGVYKNDQYAPYAEIGGSGETKQLGTDGRLVVEFDTTKFHTADEPNAANLSAEDKIDIVLEVFFDNNAYYPQLLYFDGDTSPVDAIVFGGKIAYLIGNENPQQKTPFIVNQHVESDTGSKVSIVNYTGKFGPNNRYPNITLVTEIMWWGEQADEGTAYAELVTETDMRPDGQSYVTLRYPFSDFVITRHRQVINQDTIWLGKGESGPVKFRLYAAPGQFRKSLVSRSALINMIGVELVNVHNLVLVLEELEQLMDQVNGTRDRSKSVSDYFMDIALGLTSTLNINTDLLKMKVIPSQDPGVYHTVIGLNFGNMPTVAGTPQGGGSDRVELLELRDYALAPGLSDLYKMYKGTYRKHVAETFLKDALGGHQTNPLYSFSGYFIGELVYNPKMGKEEHRVKAGGFTAGGGFELVKNINTFAGPVPVTLSLAVGGGLEVDFKTSVLYSLAPGYGWSNPDLSSVNDYLTTLRILAYLELFGGVGFDYTVAAAKIGVFGRITFEDINRWLNREYLWDASKRKKYGNRLTVEGIVGVRAVVKALFVSITYDFASYRFGHSWLFQDWREIDEYWTKNATQLTLSANMDGEIDGGASGFGDPAIQQTLTLEDRSYLQKGNRTWNTPTPGPFRLMALDPVGQAPAALQTNAYPYANPQLADDGSLFVYLSDGNSVAIEDTVAAWALRTGSGYVDQGPITEDPNLKGYGDSNLKVAGEGDLVAAVWVRQAEKIDKDPGDPLRNEDIVLMANSTEIMAAVYDGTEWTVERLTDNGTPDLAPVVAVGGGKVFVAYRGTGPAKVDNPLDFSQSDTIVYRVYDTATGLWSAPRTLYNGTNGTVRGLAAAALDDGTAAVVYAVNDEEIPSVLPADYVAGSGNEIVYAVIDTASGDVLKNLQVTHDGRTDENPQITTAVFPDGEERFVIAWHSAAMADRQLEHDIKLLAVNADGEVYGGFVDSLSALAVHQNLKVQSNFTFARMKRDWRTLGNLSLLWKEPVTEIDSNGIVTRDAIKAVKFGAEARADDGYDYYLSGALDVAEMPDFTAADSVDAYVSDPDLNEVKALILGTTYTTDAYDDHTPQKPDEVEGDEIPVTVYSAESAMYTATAVYANRFRIDEVGYSPIEIVPGFDLPIQFRLVNLGMDKIKSVSVTIDGVTHQFASGTDAELADFEPNDSRVLTVYHEVPAAIRDVSYTVEAEFVYGGRHTETGTIRLDVPDLGISEVRIADEKDGKRMLLVPIYNVSGATLAHKGRVVKLALYEDNRFDNEGLIGQVIEIGDDADLAMMDSGGYVKQIEFNLFDYLSDKDLTEIPDNGVTVFLRAWVEDAQGNIVEEFNYANNEADVRFESLAQKYGEDDVLLTLEQTNDSQATTARLTMQNMRMASITGGNVLVNLLDEDGEILESVYVASDPSQPLSFGPEQRIDKTVQFSQPGDSVQALYFTQSAPAAGAVLDEVSISGVKADFDPQQTSYQLAATDLRRTTILAAASRSDAAVTLTDAEDRVLAKGTGFISHSLQLAMSKAGAENRFFITVEADGETKTYAFVLVNTETDAPKLWLQLVGPKNVNGDFVSDVDVVVPAFDVEGFNIQHLRYRITSDDAVATASTGWIDVPYDGKSAVTIATLKQIARYAVEAEVVLEGGTKFVLDRETLRIVLSDFDATASTVTAGPNTVLANGTDEAKIVVTLRDAYGHALSGRQVSLGADGGHSVIRAVNSVTDANGEATFVVTNTHVETVGYIAKDEASGVEFPKVEVRFVTGVPDPAKSAVEVWPSEVAADGLETLTVTVTLRDASGHPLSGREVELSADRTDAIIASALSGVTDNDGKAIFTVRSTRPGEVVLTARDKAANVVTGTVRVEFREVPASPSDPGEDEPEPSQPAEPSDPGKEDPETPRPADPGSGTGAPQPNSGTNVPQPEDAQTAAQRSVFNEALIRIEALREAIAGKLQAAGGEAPAFPDAKGIWAERSIALLALLDVIRGYDDGLFHPERPATRAEVVAMLTRLFPFPDSGAQGSGVMPSDIADHWARQAIERLIGVGLMNGYPDGTFRPNAPMTREELVFVLAKLLNADGLSSGGGPGFADEADISAFAKEAVEKAVSAGIVRGYPNGTFRPKGAVTRAEAATILVNLLMMDPEIKKMLEMKR